MFALPGHRTGAASAPAGTLFHRCVESLDWAHPDDPATRVWSLVACASYLRKGAVTAASTAAEDSRMPSMA